VRTATGTTAHSPRSGRLVRESRFRDSLTVCATWALISVGAGAVAAYFSRQLGSFTYVVFGAYLSLIGALIHGVLLAGMSRGVSTRVNGFLGWVSSLATATLLLAFLALRHPQHDWVMKSFAGLWLGFATPTSAVCAGVSTYLVRLAKRKASRLGSGVQPGLSAHHPMSEA
jgi:hypothetical protein